MQASRDHKRRAKGEGDDEEDWIIPKEKTAERDAADDEEEEEDNAGEADDNGGDEDERRRKQHLKELEQEMRRELAQLDAQKQRVRLELERLRVGDSASERVSAAKPPTWGKMVEGEDSETDPSEAEEQTKAETPPATTLLAQEKEASDASVPQLEVAPSRDDQAHVQPPKKATTPRSKSLSPRKKKKEKKRQDDGASAGADGDGDGDGDDDDEADCEGPSQAEKKNKKKEKEEDDEEKKKNKKKKKEEEDGEANPKKTKSPRSKGGENEAKEEKRKKKRMKEAKQKERWRKESARKVASQWVLKGKQATASSEGDRSEEGSQDSSGKLSSHSSFTCTVVPHAHQPTRKKAGQDEGDDDDKEREKEETGITHGNRKSEEDDAEARERRRKRREEKAMRREERRKQREARREERVARLGGLALTQSDFITLKRRNLAEELWGEFMPFITREAATAAEAALGNAEQQRRPAGRRVKAKGQPDSSSSSVSATSESSMSATSESATSASESEGAGSTGGRRCVPVELEQLAVALHRLLASVVCSLGFAGVEVFEAATTGRLATRLGGLFANPLGRLAFAVALKKLAGQVPSASLAFFFSVHHEC